MKALEKLIGRPTEAAIIADTERRQGIVTTIVDGTKTGEETDEVTAAIEALETAAAENFEAWFDQEGTVTFSFVNVDVANGLFDLSGTVKGATVTMDVVAYSEYTEVGWLAADFAYYLGGQQVYTDADL